METNLFGNIQIRTKGRSRIATQALVLVLLCTTIYAFYSFDYKDVNLAEALADTWHNIGNVFFQPRLSRDTIAGVFYQLLVTFCLECSPLCLEPYWHLYARCSVPVIFLPEKWRLL